MCAVKPELKVWRCAPCMASMNSNGSLARTLVLLSYKARYRDLYEQSVRPYRDVGRVASERTGQGACSTF